MPTMSGTLLTLTPCGHMVFSPAGVIHWCGVPSLIHGVLPPCRCSVARLSLKQSAIFGYSVHMGFKPPHFIYEGVRNPEIVEKSVRGRGNPQIVCEPPHHVCRPGS